MSPQRKSGGEKIDLALFVTGPLRVFPRFSLDTNGSTEPQQACRTFQPNPPNFADMPVKIKTNSFNIALLSL